MYLKAALFTPMVFGIGVAYLIFGEKAKTILGAPPDGNPSFLGWVFYGVTFLIGFGLYFWVRAQLRGYGYSI